MFAKTFIASSLAAIALAAPDTFPFTLPCSAISGTPCICPAGATYSESVTTALVGSSASNVGHVVNDCELYKKKHRSFSPFFLSFFFGISRKGCY